MYSALKDWQRDTSCIKLNSLYLYISYIQVSLKETIVIIRVDEK